MNRRIDDSCVLRARRTPDFGSYFPRFSNISPQVAFSIYLAAVLSGVMHVFTRFLEPETKPQGYRFVLPLKDKDKHTTCEYFWRLKLNISSSFVHHIDHRPVSLNRQQPCHLQHKVSVDPGVTTCLAVFPPAGLVVVSNHRLSLRQRVGNCEDRKATETVYSEQSVSRFMGTQACMAISVANA